MNAFHFYYYLIEIIIIIIFPMNQNYCNISYESKLDACLIALALIELDFLANRVM